MAMQVTDVKRVSSPFLSQSPMARCSSMTRQHELTDIRMVRGADSPHSNDETFSASGRAVRY